MHVLSYPVHVIWFCDNADVLLLFCRDPDDLRSSRRQVYGVLRLSLAFTSRSNPSKCSYELCHEHCWFQCSCFHVFNLLPIFLVFYYYLLQWYIKNKLSTSRIIPLFFAYKNMLWSLIPLSYSTTVLQFKENPS